VNHSVSSLTYSCLKVTQTRLRKRLNKREKLPADNGLIQDQAENRLSVITTTGTTFNLDFAANVFDYGSSYTFLYTLLQVG